MCYSYLCSLITPSIVDRFLFERVGYCGVPIVTKSRYNEVTIHKRFWIPDLHYEHKKG